MYTKRLVRNILENWHSRPDREDRAEAWTARTFYSLPISVGKTDVRRGMDHLREIKKEKQHSALTYHYIGKSSWIDTAQLTGTTTWRAKKLCKEGVKIIVRFLNGE